VADTLQEECFLSDLSCHYNSCLAHS